MKYVYINNDRIVHEIIPAFADEFPGIPITERYSKEFLAHCLELADTIDVQQGMEFLPLKNVFAYPLKYTGVANAESSAGESVTVEVSFSEPGTWEITNAPKVPVNKTENSITIDVVPEGENRIELLFTEQKFGRTMNQVVTIHGREQQSTEVTA